jgi:hypothetical protein
VVGRADRHLLPQWGTQVLCSLCIYPVRDCTVLPRQPQGMDQTHGVSGATHKIDRQSKCNNKYSAVIVSCDFDFQTTRALLTSAYALYTGYIYIYIYIYISPSTETGSDYLLHLCDFRPSSDLHLVGTLCIYSRGSSSKSLLTSQQGPG